MTPTAFDFSELLILNDEWPRIPRPLEGLNETDSAIVRWLRKIVTGREAGTVQVEHVAWFVSRLMCSGGLLVWLAQERTLLDSGLREIFSESAALIPDPWAGFLRWASDQENLDSFQVWPAYTSDDDLDLRPRPQARQRKASPRRCR